MAHEHHNHGINGGGAEKQALMNHLSHDHHAGVGQQQSVTTKLAANAITSDGTTQSPFSASESGHGDHAAHGHGASGHGDMKMWFHGGCNEVVLFDWWRIESCTGMIFSCVLIFALAVLYETLKWFRVYFQMWTSSEARRARATSFAGSTGGCFSVMTKKGANGGLEKALFIPPSPNGGDNGHAEEILGDGGGGGCCGGSAPSSPSHHDAGAGGIVPGGTLTASQVYAPTVIKPAYRGGGGGTVGHPFSRFTCVMDYANGKLSDRGCRLIDAGLYGLQLLLAYWLMLIAMTFNVWLTGAVVVGAATGHWLVGGASANCCGPAPPGKGCGCAQQTENFAEDACH